MPELPEVQTVVDTLRPAVKGQRLARVELLRPDIVRPCGFNLPAALESRTVTSITRRGKRIVFALDDGGKFYIHLGMTGRLTIEANAAAVEKHTHFIVTLSAGAKQLRFRDPRRFGGIFWLGEEDRAADLGPEPLIVRPLQLAARLARTRRAIKSALLDQNLIAGLGNIYVDESLFLARLHPLMRSDRLSGEQVRRLNRAIKMTLRRAIRHRGSTLRDYVDANGDGGAFQLQHRVYDRAGEPCRTCGAKIRRIVLGGRSTHFCPRCQRPPRPSSLSAMPAAR
jgi:formamidopyrimidine-DNA glycosylase